MGTGMKRMQDSMASAGLSEPIFDQNIHSFFITFNDKELSSKLEAESAIGSEKISEKILGLLKESPELTIGELSENIDVTSRTIERNIKKLQEDGFLKRIGSDKSGHWEVL
jgi:ATP-dependent DNA helicase RecG